MNNNKKISLCGLDCSDCPCFLAYQNNNDELRVKTAKKWAKLYDQPDLKPEDMNCLGCLSLEEPVFRHCKVCEVRKCGLEKGVQNCGVCVEYKSCKLIANLHEMIPEAKEVCDKMAETE